LCGRGRLARGFVLVFRLPRLCLPVNREQQKEQNQSKN